MHFVTYFILQSVLVDTYDEGFWIWLYCTDHKGVSSVTYAVHYPETNFIIFHGLKPSNRPYFIGVCRINYFLV